MLYLSQVRGVPVEDAQGTRVGKIADVLVPPGQPAQELPGRAVYASALLVEGADDHVWRVPIESAELRNHTLRLRVPLEQLMLEATTSADQEVRLAQEVLEKQVIDVEHKKAVRVNDVCLADDWRILGIDNSTLSLVRRLAPAWLLGARSKGAPGNLVPWEDIELIGSQRVEAPALEQPEQVARSQSGQLADLRPADIADIVHQLSSGQGAQLIERLDDETAADTLEELDTDRQSYILEKISAGRAAAILQAMGPDEAADLLARLPEERAQELLALMPREESEDVQELLEYEENSAGGLMTTDYIVLNQTRSAAEALAAVRKYIVDDDIHAAYVYCVADETQDESRLLGVVSLWKLLVAEPEQPLEALMKTDLVTVTPDTDPGDVVQVFAKYNLLAVPVVSAEGYLEGVITVDDALDVLLPAGRKRKSSRMY